MHVENQGLRHKRSLPSFKDVLALTKPTIGLLVVVTAVPSMVMAAGTLPDPMVFVATVLGTIVASSAAAIFNQIIDSDIDIKMNRTRQRPLPKDIISKSQALALASALSVISFVVLARFASPLAAWVSLAANAFYVFIYTMFLKRRTSQNIVIGGAAGAVGPLIGWAAVSGQLTWEAWALFAVIFLWTPSHFWALSLKYKDDYAAAGVPMLPVVKGEAYTKLNIFLYSLTLVPPLLLLYTGDAFTLWFFVPMLVLTAVYIFKCMALVTGRFAQTPMQVFHYSCMYLFVFFAGLTIERLLFV